MNRRLGLTLLTSALMVAMLAAQDEPAPKEQPSPIVIDPKKKNADLPPIRELEKKERAPESATGEDVKKIIERLNKNMDSSEERLKKEDPGDDTRKVQGDIIKDLDELIKQQSQGGGGGGGGASGGSSSKGGKGSSSGSSSGAGQSGGSSKSGSQSKGNAQAKNKGKKGDAGTKGHPSTANKEQNKNTPDKLGKGEDKDKGNGSQTAKADPGKDGKGGGGMGGNPNANNKKDNNTIGDLFKDVWGHLPLSKRQEMDAYARERFLPKYDEILRQYYRTISEQGRRKDGE